MATPPCELQGFPTLAYRNMKYSWSCELWGLFILLLSSGLFPSPGELPHTHVLISISWRCWGSSLQIPWAPPPREHSTAWILFWLLAAVGCSWIPAHSQPRQITGPVWVSPPCATGQKLSPGSSSANWTMSFFLSQDHCLQYLLKFSIWKNCSLTHFSCYSLSLKHNLAPITPSLPKA